MVVDNEPGLCKVIERILRRNGYEDICFTHSARNCVEYLEKNLCDIVVISLNMPDVNGFILGELLRERYPFMPMIAMSDTDALEAIDRAEIVGFSDYIVKPVFAENLLVSLETQILRLDNPIIQSMVAMSLN
jgi:DNA-binding NtrC family response regulator